MSPTPVPDGALDPAGATTRVRARNGRRVLAAVREHVAVDGIDDASMRELAVAADVSVRTLYNLFDDRTGLVRALVLDFIADINLAVGDLEATTSVARLWEATELAMGAVATSLPRSVLASALDDPELLVQLSQRWDVRDVLVGEIRRAQEAGELHDDLDPNRLVDQVGMAMLNLLRGWAADLIDDDALVAGTLHALDICLLAIAPPDQRDRLRDHALALAPRLTRPVPR